MATMRRFLLFLGSLGVGLFSVLFIPVILFSGDFTTTAEAVLGWLAVLLVGVALSTPFFVDPPAVIKVWNRPLPLPLAIALIVVRVLSWIGLMILRGIWWVIYRFWDPRPVHPPAPAIPQQIPFAGTTPVLAQQPTGAVPASWQTDPTGRNLQRYWDGQKWTEHVANSGVMAIDPI
jgi:hypothetical protein